MTEEKADQNKKAETNPGPRSTAAPVDDVDTTMALYDTVRRDLHLADQLTRSA